MAQKRGRVLVDCPSGNVQVISKMYPRRDVPHQVASPRRWGARKRRRPQYPTGLVREASEIGPGQAAPIPVRAA